MKTRKFLGSGAVIAFEYMILKLEWFVDLFDFEPKLLSAFLYSLFYVICAIIIVILPQTLKTLVISILSLFTFLFIWGGFIAPFFESE